MADDVQQPATVSDQDLPEKLRVHSLARVLGTTGTRCSTCSPSSTTGPAAPNPASSMPTPSGSVTCWPPGTPPPPRRSSSPTAKPESRLILETHVEAEEPPAYMPLFVAPQPVARPEPTDESEDSGVSEDSEEGADSEEDDEAGDGESPPGQSPAPPGPSRPRPGQGRAVGRGRRGNRSGSSSRWRSRRGRGFRRGGPGPRVTAQARTAQTRTNRTRTAQTRTAAAVRPRPAAGAVGAAASPDPATTPATTPRQATIRPTPSCMSAPRAPRSGPIAPTRSRASADPPVWRPSVSAAATVVTRAAAVRRSCPRPSSLARREAVDRVMVVRDKSRTEPPHQGEEALHPDRGTRGRHRRRALRHLGVVGLTGGQHLSRHRAERAALDGGGLRRHRPRPNGVLYAGEVNWEAAGLGGSQRKIEQALKPGDYVVVQVSKDPVGHKGARLTTQISLAGRYLVYVPGASSTGISRKLPDTERQRLKEILREVVPADAGVIIRTASEGVKEEHIRADVNRLQEHWNTIAAKSEEVQGQEGRRRDRALRGARCPGQGDPRPVQRGFLRSDHLRRQRLEHHHRLRRFRCPRASFEDHQV